MESSPLIILYTSSESAEESSKLRSLIDKTGLKYEEHVVDQARHSEMIRSFGGQVQVPGIQVDNVWISDHDENIADFIGKYWLDKMLASTANGAADTGHEKKNAGPSDSRRAAMPAARPKTKASGDIEFDPNINLGVTTVAVEQAVGVKSRSLLVSAAPSDEESIVDEWTVFTDPTFAMDETVSPNATPVKPSNTASDATEGGIDAPPESSPELDIDEETTSPEGLLCRTIRLPTGSDVSVVQLMRLLLGATEHKCFVNGNVLYYYFRGHEGINVWRGLFFDRDAEGSEEEAVQFGRTLVKEGIVHNYTPNEADLNNCFLVLQPLQEPRLLNTFLLLIPSATTKAAKSLDPMQVIVDLSHAMDDLCDEIDGLQPRELVSRFHQIEEQVCLLQVVNFPVDAREKVTFGLNLFNLIVRHVMLLSNETLLKHGDGQRHWSLSWPTNLEQMEQFMRTVCYSVGGKCYSLASLRDSLYGHAERSVPIVPRSEASWLSRLLCRGTEPASPERVEFATPVIKEGDPRILFAMTWGTQSSPVVTTIYPKRLSEGLQTHAQMFCQNNVQVKNGIVILPSLLSWHRKDFGRDPETVLYKILGYLSQDQLAVLRGNKSGKKFEVVFSDEYKWKPGMNDATKSRDGASIRQQRAKSQDSGFDVDATENEGPAVVPEPVLLNDPSPQGPAGRSINSKTTASKATTTSLRSLFDHKLVQRLTRLTRGTSHGDMQPAPYHRGLHDTSIDEDDDDDSNAEGDGMYDDDDEDDDVRSFFHSTISGITYGSEFEDLLLGARRNRRLQI